MLAMQDIFPVILNLVSTCNSNSFNNNICNAHRFDNPKFATLEVFITFATQMAKSDKKKKN